MTSICGRPSAISSRTLKPESRLRKKTSGTGIKVILIQGKTPKYWEKSELKRGKRPRYCGQRAKLSTLSTEFSTFNIRFSHAMWKVDRLLTIQHPIHNSSTIPWKTKHPHHDRSLQSFPHLPHPLLRLLQQVQYRKTDFCIVSHGKRQQN